MGSENNMREKKNSENAALMSRLVELLGQLKMRDQAFTLTSQKVDSKALKSLVKTLEKVYQEIGAEIQAKDLVLAATVSRETQQGPTPVERALPLDPTQPDWEAIEALPLTMTRKKSPASINALVETILRGRHLKGESVVVKEEARIQVAPLPFARGPNRLVYYGRYYPDGLPPAGPTSSSPPSPYQEVVLKEFISSERGANRAVQYKAQLETQTVASFLARAFNEHAAAACPEMDVPKFEYVPTDLVYIGPKGSKRPRLMTMEPLLRGEMRKWNNNCGAVDLLSGERYLQAFSHWSYEVTGRALMVVDVQGFHAPDAHDGTTASILLTDPAIHCVSADHFGPTNLGVANGFDLFLHSHQELKLCGLICDCLLPKCEVFSGASEDGDDASAGNSCCTIDCDNTQPNEEENGR